MVKWSECLPSSPAIRVRIFSCFVSKLVLENIENKQNEAGLGPSILKQIIRIRVDYHTMRLHSNRRKKQCLNVSDFLEQFCGAIFKTFRVALVPVFNHRNQSVSKE